jgi:hypothetical protein
MIVTSRRSLILGITSLVVAPALVRAASIMQLRGENIDPWVWAFRSKVDLSNTPPMVSEAENWSDVTTQKRWFAQNDHLNYSRVRVSEAIPNVFVKRRLQHELGGVIQL